MNKTWVVCIIFMALTLAGFAKTDFESGKRLFERKQYAEAIPYFEKTVKDHPDWYPGVYLKGRCYFHLDKYPEALRDFNDALTMKTPPAAASGIKYYVAMTYMNMKDYDKAIYSFSRLIPEAPKDKHFSLYLNRGQCEMQLALLNQDNLDNARSYYHKGSVSFAKALESPTRNEQLKYQAAYQKGLAEYKLAEMEKNLTGLEKSMLSIGKAIALNPREKKGHELMVNAAFRLVELAPDAQKRARYLEAVKPIDRYLALWPDEAEMLEKKGDALQGAKKYREAIAVFQDLVRIRPDADAFFSLGSCQMAAKQYQAALNSFEKAKSGDGQSNPSLYSYSAHCLISQKTNCYQTDIPLYDRAIQILEKGVASVSGPARTSLNRDLVRAKANLEVLQGNRETDDQNHLAAIENIKKLKETIRANTQMLQNNRDNYLDQPTEELKTAIDQAQASIRADQLTLEQEFKTLTRYLDEADKCGGQKSFQHYARMRALVDEKGA